MRLSVKSSRSLRAAGMSSAAILNVIGTLKAGFNDLAGPPTAKELEAILHQNEGYPPRQGEALAEILLECRRS